jgi:hypothetical protein
VANEISAVLEFGVAAPRETATMMEDKLRFHTDSWDLSVDLKAALADIMVIDAVPEARFGLPEVKWAIYPFGGRFRTDKAENRGALRVW